MGAAEGSKRLVQDLINLWKIKRNANPALILKKLTDIYNVLEDVYSVEGIEEIQSAIDQIGTGAGTIFIEAGTHIIDTPIDLDGCGSIVIYGHGNNTILKPVDGVTVFNITCCNSLLIKTLRIDISGYTGATQAVIVNEVNNNIVGFEDVTIDGTGGTGNGIGIELQSDNCIIDKCNIFLIQTGIFINSSENHIINNNLLALNTNYGLHLDLGDANTISGNSLVSNTLYGIYIYDSDYCIISHNGCFDNLLTGIYSDISNNNTISNNICSGNFQNGIYITQGSHNTISGNTTNNNNSNTANPQAGIYITNNSDFNTISANSCNNNNNAGAGTGYGILIHAATCDENMVAANNANGNDVDFMDSGTDTTIEYFVQDYFELQDAINSIGTKSGIINLEGSFAVNATITINGGGSYIIRGAGSNTTLTSADITCINITLARSVLLENFKIDASAVTGRNTPVIIVNETNDDLIVIDNIEITGIVARGWGIDVLSDYVQIRNCNFTTIDIGIRIAGDYCQAQSNICNGMDEYGIDCIGDYAIITNNTCNSCNDSGIQMNGGSYCNVSQNQCHSNANYGIFVFSLDNMVLADNIFTLNDAGIKIEDSNYVNVGGNDSSGNTTTGIMITGTSSYNIVIGNTCINNAAGYGIIVGAAACVENIVKSNNLSGNNWQVWDLGTNSDFEYRCSTAAEIQDAIDSIAAKSGVVRILPIAGGIQLTAVIDVDGGGDYIIEGEGVGSIIDCAGNRTAFNITSATYCKISNLKIDADDHTANFTNSIAINEGSNNRVVIEHVTIVNPAGVKFGRGVFVGSDNCVVQNCTISKTYIGIQIDGVHNLILNNNITETDNSGITILGDDNEIIGNDCNNNDISAIKLLGAHSNIVSNNNCNYNGAAGQGIYLSASNMNVIIGNQCSGNFHYGIHIYQSNYNNIIGNNCSENDYDQVNSGGGIWIDTNSDYNIMSGNVLYGNVNIGAGTSFGINIFDVTCNENRVGVNLYRTNDTDYNDDGTGTILSGDDTVYGVGWNGDLGTATKNAIYDKIELVIAAGGAPNAFATITGITNDVVADNNADTLTLAAVGGLTIVGTAATDTITFTNTITQYTDVMVENVITAELVNGQSIDNRIDALLTANADGYQTQANVEAIIDAELVDGQSIDNRIDALIAAVISDAIYDSFLWDANTDVPTKNAVRDKIEAMSTLIAANTTVLEVEAVITAELVDGQSIDNRIDALLTANADGYQTQANVEAIIDAELVDGQSIDNRIDALIAATDHVNAAGAVAAVEAAGLTLAAGQVITSQDADLNFTFGRARIWSNVADSAAFGHIDQALPAIDISAVGATRVLATAAQTLSLIIGIATQMSLDGTDVTLSVPIAMGANKITGLANGAAATDAMAFGQKTSTADIEAVITAELVDGQSIDNRIDALLAASFGFKTIVPSAGENVVADAESDTLNLTGGGDITITGVAATDTITIALTKYTNAEAVAAVATADDYIKNDANDVMTGDLTINNLITAGNVDGVDISSIVTFKTITGITNDVVADLLTDTLTLAAAGGLTIVGTAATDTITFTNTITQYTDALVRDVITAELVDGQSIDNRIDALLAASFGFKTIVPSAGENVVADAESDTLNLTGGGDITITGVAATDTITIALTKYTNAEAVAAVEAAGLTLAAAQVITSQDADLNFTFGRLKIGSYVADSMYISHIDKGNATDFALRQLQNGITHLNTSTGNTIHFKENGVTIMNMQAGGFQIGGGARIDEVENSDTLASNSDTKLCTQGNVVAYAASKTNLNEAHAIGSANKRWLTLNLEGTTATSFVVRTTPHYSNLGATDYSMVFNIPLPNQIVVYGTTYNLVITQNRYGIIDSDADDYCTAVRYYGWTTASPPVLSGALRDVDHDVVHGKGVGTFTNDHADLTVGGVYRRTVFYFSVFATTAGEFDLGYAQIEYYYA